MVTIREKFRFECVLVNLEENDDDSFARRDSEDNDDDARDTRESPYSIGKRINAWWSISERIEARIQ